MDGAVMRNKQAMTLVIGGLLLGALGAGGLAIAQNQNDLRRAAFQMSKESAAAGEMADAVEALQPLAESGDAMAQYGLGVLYRTGGKDLPAAFQTKRIFTDPKLGQ